MGQAAGKTAHPEVPYLKTWHRAKERGRRFNRNLLQYAGALAALLGIGGGAGSVLAVALSVVAKEDGADDWMFWLLGSLAAVVGVIVVPLVLYMRRAFRLRLEAEVEANNALDELIKLEPERFWPPVGQE